MERQISIKETLTHQDYILMNRIWYRADPAELSQFYKALGKFFGNDSRFWAIVPHNGASIRKIHTGLPALIIDMLNDITNDDCLGVTIDEDFESDNVEEKGPFQTLWDEIAKDNDFMKVQKDATQDALSEGDGAFKISIDLELSEYPIIEFYSGEDIDYLYKRGRLFEVLFRTYYLVEDKYYRLEENYGINYIECKLYDDNNKELDLAAIDQTKGLLPRVDFDGDYIMAVPMMFFKSSKFKNRGKSIIDGKYDAFDALDEIVSQWLDAIRLGRANKFIPDKLIPRDTEGNKIPYNPITNQFYTYETLRVSDESNSEKAEHVQPDIAADKFLASYIQYIDMCLMGTISPSTLGMDVKKLDNGEAQREKEKATMYTRNKIIKGLEKAIPKLVEAVLKTYDNMKKQTPGEYKVSIEFGEYANPSFEAIVETVGKAKEFKIMSTERAIEELYGNSMTDEEKALEVQRIKDESSMSIPGEGQFGGMDDFFTDDNDDENNNDDKDKTDDKKPEEEDKQ